MNDAEKIARDVAALCACVGLDRDTDPRRVLPVIPSVALWRILPRLIRKAAPDMMEREREFCLNLAADIEQGRPAPSISPGKAV